MKTEPEEMADQYRFDYKKAKPNRFAEKMNLNVGWTVEKFVAEETREEKPKKSAPKKAAPAKKAKPTKPKAPAKKSKPVKKPAAKTSSPKGKKYSGEGNLDTKTGIIEVYFPEKEHAQRKTNIR